MMKTLLIISLFLYCQLAISGTDYISTKRFGNIFVSIMTSDSENQIIEEAWILGQMAQKLSKKHLFKDTILINISDLIQTEANSVELISYSRGFDFRYFEYGFFDDKKFELYSNANSIEYNKKLKLIEYIILNRNSIIKESLFTYDVPPIEGLKSIDPNIIEKVVTKPNSGEIISVLKSKTYQILKEEENIGITYFYSDSSYKITAKNHNNEDTVILDINSIKSFQPINSFAIFVIASDSNFYFISNLFSQNITINEKSINPTLKSNRNLKFSAMNSNYFFLNDSYYKRELKYEPFLQDSFPTPIEKERIIIYDQKRDLIIQDIDSLIEKNFR